MKISSKDHQEMMVFFEKVFKGQFRLDREEKAFWPKGAIYQNVDANNAFKAFREGVAYGVAVQS